MITREVNDNLITQFKADDISSAKYVVVKLVLQLRSPSQGFFKCLEGGQTTPPLDFMFN